MKRSDEVFTEFSVVLGFHRERACVYYTTMGCDTQRGNTTLSAFPAHKQLWVYNITVKFTRRQRRTPTTGTSWRPVEATSTPSLSPSCPPPGRAVAQLQTPHTHTHTLSLTLTLHPLALHYFPESLLPPHPRNTCHSRWICSTQAWYLWQLCHTSYTPAICTPRRGWAQLGSEQKAC